MGLKIRVKLPERASVMDYDLTVYRTIKMPDGTLRRVRVYKAGITYVGDVYMKGVYKPELSRKLDVFIMQRYLSLRE